MLLILKKSCLSNLQFIYHVFNVLRLLFSVHVLMIFYFLLFLFVILHLTFKFNIHFALNLYNVWGLHWIGWLVSLPCWWWVVPATMVKRLSEKLSVLQEIVKNKDFFRYGKQVGELKHLKRIFFFKAWALWTIIATTAEKVFIIILSLSLLFNLDLIV